jgi:hypothetical protein
MRLDERDLVLSFENHTRQVWAEKHLEMPPSADQAAWTNWYNYLHDQVENGFKLKWPGAVDMNPPGKGLLFEPLDSALLKRDEFSRCLIANRSGLFGFEDVKTEAVKVQDAQYTRISDQCLVRGTEAVRRADSPNAQPLRSDQVLACSVAAIPLLRCEEDKDGVPLAAVFTWRKMGKIKSASFHMGDVASRSERLRRFQNRLASGEFNNSVVVCTDERSQDFVSRFAGEQWGAKYFDIETAANPSHYHHPAQQGASLEVRSALFGLTPPPPRSLDQPAAVLKMACAPSRAKLEADPALKAIFAELSWRNQVVMELSDAIALRCEAAQKFDQVERYNEDLAGEKRTWLFFPVGDLDRRLEVEKNLERREGGYGPQKCPIDRELGGQTKAY